MSLSFSSFSHRLQHFSLTQNPPIMFSNDKMLAELSSQSDGGARQESDKSSVDSQGSLTNWLCHFNTQLGSYRNKLASDSCHLILVENFCVNIETFSREFLQCEPIDLPYRWASSYYLKDYPGKSVLLHTHNQGQILIRR